MYNKIIPTCFYTQQTKVVKMSYPNWLGITELSRRLSILEIQSFLACWTCSSCKFTIHIRKCILFLGSILHFSTGL